MNSEETWSFLLLFKRVREAAWVVGGEGRDLTQMVTIVQRVGLPLSHGRGH